VRLGRPRDAGRCDSSRGRTRADGPEQRDGRPAAAAWCRGEPFGPAVPTATPDGIAAITLFGGPGLVEQV
jgi:hypothetical protein